MGEGVSAIKAEGRGVGVRKILVVRNGLEWDGVVIRKGFGDEEGTGVRRVGSEKGQESRMGSELHTRLHLQLVG